MNSSTSNSKVNTNLPTKTMNTSRKIYAKTVLALGLCMIAAMALITLYLESNNVNKHGILGRVSEAQAALPKILEEPNELVMFFGSSMTGSGFSPRQFDKALALQGKKIKSFNFGFGGLNPYFQDLLSKRIAEQFNNSDRRLKLAMIEFNPFQASQTRWRRALPNVDSFVAMLASDKELLAIAKKDIKRGIRLFNIKYVRNTERQRLRKLLDVQFEKEYPNYIAERWKYSWQGAGTIPEERSAETLALIDQYHAVSHTDARMKNFRLGRIRSADIEGLNFEPLLVQHFIDIVKNFQEISDNVEVILLPKNSKWIHYSPAAKKRLAEAIKQIERATGVTIKNHQDIPEINSTMYSDATHLSRYRGGVPYTKYLIKEFSQLL